LCAEDGGDTTDRVNPWAGILKDKPVKISVYVDNSTSMKGYFLSNNLSPLVTVLSGIQQLYAGNEISGYYVEKNSLKSYSFDKLSRDITQKKLSGYSDAFQLDGLIANIVSNYKANCNNDDIINFIITDGIPSGTNEEIRNSRNRMFNISSASLLQARIATAFNGAKGIAASVYQFKSGFDGGYWYYDNLSPKLEHWSNRPFYVIAIGSKDLVMSLAEKENDGLVENFKPANKVHFGAVDKDKIKLTGPFEDGTVVDPTVFKEAQDEDGYNGTVTIHPQLQLTGLPYFARTEEFLKNNMTITLDGKVPNWKLEGKNLTITMRIEQFKTYKLKIKINDNTTSFWVDNATCLNDRKVGDKELANKTFNLKFLVEGLKSGVSGSVLFENEFEISTDAEEN
jgi:hypothetical protein